ncbi:hypothetical protein NKJ88_31360 [Mesorhizobium sp. M0016]|uniref:type III secretion apparatus assembly protein SctX n=1 Tax=Mesorhizobium sp. M0016 TaxID=2956843 RepID=UPI00333BA808
MNNTDFDSLNYSNPTASGPAELRRTRLDVGGLIPTELVVPLLDVVRAPVVDTQPALQFDLLYHDPTVDDLMMAAFAPSIANPGVLDSPTYAATLKAAHASLADLAAQTRDSDCAVFRDALSVLDQALADRFLFDNACRALMQG